jgi:hypothetical protein
MNGNNQRHAPLLMPEETLQRTTVYDALRENRRLGRALEILSQLCFVQNNWTLRDLPVPFNIDPQVMADKLHTSGIAIDDILDSRGWWTYGDHPQPFLSLYDILAIVQGAYKPKFLAVKPAAPPKP